MIRAEIKNSTAAITFLYARWGLIICISTSLYISYDSLLYFDTILCLPPSLPSTKIMCGMGSYTISSRLSFEHYEH